MRRILVDCETTAWACPRGVPELVVLAYAEEGHTPTLVVDRAECVRLWRGWINDPAVTIVAHNAPFDCTVLASAADPDAEPGTGPEYEAVIRAYEAQRIECTEIRHRLLDMFDSEPDDRGYSLGAICGRVFDLDLSADKDAPQAVRALMRQGVPCSEWPPDVLDACPWRYKYGLLLGVPLEQWPEDAKRYAAEDVDHEWLLWRWQEDRADRIAAAEGIDPLADQFVEAIAAYDLKILSLPGFAVDKPRVHRLIDLYHAVERACADVLATHCAWCGAAIDDGECSRCGVRDTLIVRKAVHKGKPNERTDEHASQSLARAVVWERLGAAQAERTDGARARAEPIGPTNCKCDAKALMRCVTALGGRHVTTDDGVHAYQRGGVDSLREYLRSLDAVTGGVLCINARRLYNKCQKTRTSFLAHLLSPDGIPVRTSYQPIVSTTRTSARAPNVQNLPARTVKDQSISVRGCFVAPPGYLFTDADYSQIELAMVAQVITDMRRTSSGDPTYVSSLAQAINDGKDGHLIVAAQLLDCSYAEAVDQYAAGDKAVSEHRQLSKVANYGYWGGMGPAKFVEFAAAQGVSVTLAMAQKAKAAFLAAWHEAAEFFAVIGAECRRGGGAARMLVPRTNVVRGVVPFCAACNITFQGATARGAKQALRGLIDASYRDQASPMLGTRPLAFVHDEFLCAAPIRSVVDPAVRAEQTGKGWAIYQGDSFVCGHPDEPTAAVLSVVPALAEQMRIMVDRMQPYCPDVRIKTEGKIMDRWTK